MTNIRFEYEDYLKDLSPEDQVKELKQFFIDMMDYMEQSPGEKIYIQLHELAKKIDLNEEKLNSEEQFRFFLEELNIIKDEPDFLTKSPLLYEKYPLVRVGIRRALFYLDNKAKDIGN